MVKKVKSGEDVKCIIFLSSKITKEGERVIRKGCKIYNNRSL
jgi:ribosome-associated protein YbcJ (S4-like RNA binding protein)